MNKYAILFTFLLSTFIFAQKTIDRSLVGYWKSTISPSKNDPTKGIWLINRKEDGTFITYIELIHKNDSVYAKQSGEWWTDKGSYFESNEENSFSYKLNGNQVEFKVNSNLFSTSFKTSKYVELKTDNESEYFENKYSVFTAKTMKKIFDMQDSSNGFSYDTTDGEQDQRFVGVWTGSEKDNQEEGLTKEWTMTRKADGTFTLDFRTKMKGRKKDSFTESGKWWIKDGKFYEYHEESEMTDVYNFEVLNQDQIKFKAFKLSYDQNNSEYEFIDTRKK